jgi:prevent-host-death family protein
MGINIEMRGRLIMPNIRPISDLRNNANDISEFCHTSREPVFITKNGVGDLVVMSIEAYERQQALISLYTKLAEAEEEITNDPEGEDFFDVAKQLRSSVHGQV